MSKVWCKFGAKTYRTIRKLCHDMRRKRHKITQNGRYSTIFRGINASEKTRRDNSPNFIYKALWFHRALFFAYRRIIPLERRLTELGSVIRTKNSRLDCFCGFTAVLTVHEEIISTLSNTKNAQLRLGIFYYSREN